MFVAGAIVCGFVFVSTVAYLVVDNVQHNRKPKMYSSSNEEHA